MHSPTYPVAARIRHLWRVERTLEWARGLAIGLLAGGVWTGLLVAADCLLRYGDRGANLLASLVWATGLVVIGFLLVVSVRRRGRAGPLGAARRIERRHPSLGTRLSSAYDFETAGGSRGSSHLQRALVEDVARELEHFRWWPELPWRRAVAWIVLATAAGLGASVAIHSSAPESWPLALRRLVRPWNPPAWPKRHQLRIVAAPEVVARGATLEVVVADRRRELPADLALIWRRRGRRRSQVVRFEPQGRVARLHLPNLTESIEYRVTGGDDLDMPWRHVRVIDPPRWDAQVILIKPPAYTRLEPSTARGAVRAPAGSQLILRGMATAEVVGVELITDSAGALGTVTLRQRPDERWESPPGSWRALRTGSYAVRLSTADGLQRTTDPLPVTVDPDRPPVVTIVQPESAARVTRRSRLPLSVRVSDDIGLSRVEWRLQAEARYSTVDRSGSDGDRAAATAAPPAQGGILGRWDSVPGPLVREERLETVLDLASMEMAGSGAWTLRVTATDCKGNRSAVAERTVEIVSPDALQDDLRQWRRRLLAALQRAETAQVELRDELRQWMSAPDRVERAAGTGEGERKTAWLVRQQRLARQLSGSDTSIDRMARTMETLIWQHRLDVPDTVRRLGELRAALAQLVAGPASRIEAVLDRFPARGDRAAWSAGVEAQDAIVAELQRLRAAWEMTDRRDGLRRTLDAMLRPAERLLERLADLRADALRGDAKPAEQAARREGLARDVESLRRNWESWRAEAGRLARQAPRQTREVVERALRASRRRRVGAAIDAVAEELRHARLHRAVAGQQQVVDSLREVARQLDTAPHGDSMPAGQDAAAADHVTSWRRRASQWHTAQKQLFEAVQSIAPVDRGASPTASPTVSQRRIIATRQRKLAQTVESYHDATMSPLIGLVLQDLAATMKQAASTLERTHGWNAAARGDVLRAQRAALEGLEQLLAANDRSAADRNGTSPSGGQRQPKTAGRTALDPVLLRQLQASVMRQTVQLEAARRRGGSTAAWEDAVKRLAERQQALAALIRESRAAGNRPIEAEKTP